MALIKDGFQRVSGADRGLEKGAISSITVAEGDLLAYNRSSAILELATASTSMEDVAGVAVAAATTADTEVLFQRITVGDKYVARTTNNSNAAHNYQRMILTDEDAVNNTGTDSTSDAAVVMQLAPVGAASNKQILVEFVRVVDRA
jgi:hypothetical protein